MFVSRNDTLVPDMRPMPAGLDSLACGSLRPSNSHPGALTIVAHDMRGPLTSLRLLVEAMGNKAGSREDDMIARYSRRAERVLDSLDTLLNGILERVRDTGDPLVLKPEPIDLLDLIDDAVALNTPRATAKGLKLQTVSAGPCEIRGDRQLLLQVMDNILGNAIKHSPSGRNVTCLVEERENGATVTIRDEGPGMTPADLKRAFGPFSKLSAKAKDDARSFGLGLWFAKLIVGQHGGGIEVRSAGAGQGTEFRIMLGRDVQS